MGRKTLLALQKRANNEVYAGDNFEFPKNPVVDKKLAALATTVDAVDAKQSTTVTSEAGEASTTIPSSETKVAETKTTASETFVDTPEKQATRKLMEEAEAVRIAKLQVGNNTQTKTPVQETSSGDEYDDLRNSPANMTPEQASKVEATTAWTPPRATTSETNTQATQATKREVSTTDSFSSLNEKYDK